MICKLNSLWHNLRTRCCNGELFGLSDQSEEKKATLFFSLSYLSSCDYRFGSSLFLALVSSMSYTFIRKELEQLRQSHSSYMSVKNLGGKHKRYFLCSTTTTETDIFTLIPGLTRYGWEERRSSEREKSMSSICSIGWRGTSSYVRHNSITLRSTERLVHVH